jgi:hypothetical protein
MKSALLLAETAMVRQFRVLFRIPVLLVCARTPTVFGAAAWDSRGDYGITIYTPQMHTIQYSYSGTRQSCTHVLQ